MELRIGVVHTAKELNLELDGSADEIVGTIDKAHGRRHADDLGHRHEGSAGRHPARRGSPTSRSTRTARTSESASAASTGTTRRDGPGARTARPPPAVLHRQGRRRQEHRHRGHGAARGRARASACCWWRSTPRTTSPHCSSTRRSASSRVRCTPACSRCRWTPRRRCASTSRCKPKVPVFGRIGPDRRRVRLRGHRRAGREGDPHRRQGVLGAPRVARRVAPTGISSSSTPPPPVT